MFTFFRTLSLPIWLLVVLSFLLGMNEFIIIGIIPDLAKTLGVSLTDAGTTVSVFAFAYALGTPFCAALAGLFDRNRAFAVGLLIFTVFMALSIVDPNYDVFLICRVILALVSGTLLSLSMAFAEEMALPGQAAPVVACIFSGFSIASVFGVPLATAWSHFMGWRLVFITLSLISLVVSILLVKTLPPAKQRPATNLWHQFALLKNKQILLCAACVFCTAGASYTFYTYFSPYLQHVLGIPAPAVSIGLFLYGIAALVSNIFSGKLGANYTMPHIPGLYVAQGIILAALAFFSYSLELSIIILAVLGLLMYLINAPAQMYFLTIANKRYPDCINLSSSLSPVCFNYGIAAGSFTGSFIVDTFQIQDVGFGGVIFAVVGLVCCLLLRHIDGEIETQ